MPISRGAWWRIWEWNINKNEFTTMALGGATMKCILGKRKFCLLGLCKQLKKLFAKFIGPWALHLLETLKGLSSPKINTPASKACPSCLHMPIQAQLLCWQSQHNYCLWPCIMLTAVKAAKPSFPEDTKTLIFQEEPLVISFNALGKFSFSMSWKSYYSRQLIQITIKLKLWLENSITKYNVLCSIL